MIRTPYPLEWWLTITNKFWTKIIVTLVGILVVNGIWFLQPRFGHGFDNITSFNGSYGYSGSQSNANIKSYCYTSNKKILTIDCEKGTRNYKITTANDTVVEVVYRDNKPIMTILNTSFKPEEGKIYFNDLEEKLGFEYYFITEVVTSDVYYLGYLIPSMIINSALVSVAILLFLFCNRWTYGILSRPVAVNLTIGTIILIYTILHAFRIF